MFLLFNGHVLKGVLTSGGWRELVVSDCLLATGQKEEFRIARCNSFPKISISTTSGAQDLREADAAGLLALGSFRGERSGLVRLTPCFWGNFLTHLAISAEERLLGALV